jgi:hypothetical protein
VLWKEPHGMPVRFQESVTRTFRRLPTGDRHIPQRTSPNTKILTFGAKNKTKTKQIIRMSEPMVVTL